MGLYILQVTCPQLKWPVFPAFKNNDMNTGCWDEVAPGNGEVIQDTNTEGLTLQRNPEVP